MASLRSVLLEHVTPSISVDIEGVARRLILDTGSNVSIMQPGISGSAVEVTHIRPYGVTRKSSILRANRLFLLWWTDASLVTRFWCVRFPLMQRVY